MMNNSFIHLKTRSHYSILEGSITINDIVKSAIKHNMPAIALTDNCNLFGAMEFSQLAIENGIQPINGSIINVTNQDIIDFNNNNFEITLLVKDYLGWKNLSKIVSYSYKNYKEYNSKVINMMTLRKFNKGLIVLYSDIKQNSLGLEKLTLIEKNKIEELIDIFQDRLYLDLFRENKNISIKEKNILDLSKFYNLPLVCTNNISFLEPDMYEAHNCLSCIYQSTTVNNSDRELVNKETYFKSTSAMEEIFSDKSEVLINTFNIAKRCSFILEENKPKLPSLNFEGNKNEEDILRDKSLKGLEERIRNTLNYSLNKNEKINYYNRLEYELNVICNMGYAGYFLIVSDFIIWAKNKNIPVGPGRGSGAGSIVAWSLLITDLDPIKYGLLFERFLNPDRVSLPDFDIDFCKYRREEVIEYVRDKYGKDKVAQIITFGSLQARAVIRDVGRVLGFNLGRVDKIAKLIPNTPGVQQSLAQLLKESELLKQSIKEDKELEKLFEISLKLEGLNRNASTHAAGIVISNQNITEDVPLYYDSRSNIPATQFSMKYLEKIGLIKFDFLGLETLSVLDQTVKLIKKRNVEIDLDKIQLDHKQTYDTLTEGNTLGVFQLESIPMRQVLKQLKPDRIEDIIAVVALYRPGPMENIPAYIERKHNNSLTTYPHKLLKDVLEETYGIMIYQEQVMESARIIAGFSLAKADLLRRAMGKKIKSEMQSLKESFIEGSKSNNINSIDAGKIFNNIEKFAGYGFNKSHAAAYAIISYQTAWCKTNYPAEFYTALLNSEIGNATEKISYIKAEIIKQKIVILKSDINRSQVEFSVEKFDGKLAIRSGLCNIKNIGVDLAEYIITERKNNGKYISLINFAKRLNPSLSNKRQIEYLAMAGVFDQLEQNRAIAFNSASNLLKISQTILREKMSNQANIFNSTIEDSQYENLLSYSSKWPNNIFYLNEYKALGFFISGNPLTEELDFFHNFNLSNSNNLEENKVNGKVFELLGFLVKYEEKSINNTKFFDLFFIDNEGAFNIRVYSEVMDKEGYKIIEGKSYVLSVIHTLDRENRMRLRLKSIRECDKYMSQAIKEVKIHLKNLSSINELKHLLIGLDSGYSSIIFVCDNKEIFSGLKVNYVESVFQKIENKSGIKNIEKLI